jgi:hypothetical protein
VSIIEKRAEKGARALLDKLGASSAALRAFKVALHSQRCKKNQLQQKSFPIADGPSPIARFYFFPIIMRRVKGISAAPIEKIRILQSGICALDGNELPGHPRIFQLPISVHVPVSRFFFYPHEREPLRCERE